jgi:glycolate oxidase FAD binding subunit
VAVSAAAHLPAGAITGLRIEGFGPSVDARCLELARDFQSICSIEVIEGEESRAFWQRLGALDMLPIAGHVLWRISQPPAAGWKLASALGALGAQCVYDWAGALLWAALPEDRLDADSCVICDLARAHGGNAALIRAPPERRRPSSGAPARDPGMRRLQSSIKAGFDPLGILNPGLDLGAGL